MKIIHIKAESEFVSSNELIPENKAVKRLEQIKKAFRYMKLRNGQRFPDAKLVVKTCVHNPELFS